MYARATLLEIDTVRISVADTVALFQEEVLPDLRHQAGYRGVLVLTTGEGKGVLMTLWADQESAEAEARFYEAEIAKYLTLFRAPPGREAYRVELVDGLTVASA